ncbi:MAG: hypothetical protein ACK5LR_06590 [Mangrovibacterium sp.]
MNKHTIHIYTLILTACFSLVGVEFIQAQNNTRNPYSMYGLGELKPQVNIVTSGMGNTGIAIQNSKFINMLNPASYQGVDSCSVIFDSGVDAKYSNFKQGNDDNQTFNANFSYFALACRLSPKFAMGLGLNPYSSSGYEIYTTAEIEGTIASYPIVTTGDGDISRAYLALSYAPFKNFSLGVKGSFLFGKRSQTEIHDISILSGYSSTVTVSNLTSDYFYNFYFELGAQYQFNIKNNTIGLGAVVTPKQGLVTHRETASYSSLGVVYDEGSTGTSEYPMPLSVGVGISFDTHKHFLFALDMGMQNWSDYHYAIKKADLTNNPYVNFGMEYTPSQNFLAPFFQRVNYRFGARYQEDYLVLRGNQLKDIAISTGMGFPIRKGTSRIDLSVELGSYGTQRSNLIRENYVRLRLGFSMHDIWFQMRRFN